MTEVLNKTLHNPGFLQERYLTGRGSNSISRFGGEDERPAILYTTFAGSAFYKLVVSQPNPVVLEVIERTSANGDFIGRLIFFTKEERLGGLSKDQIDLIQDIMRECREEIKAMYSSNP